MPTCYWVAVATNRNRPSGRWKLRNGSKRDGRSLETTKRTDTERNGWERHEWSLHGGSQTTEMVDMEVKMRGEKTHSQKQPQYSRSAFRDLEKHIHKQMMNQLTAKSYNSLAHHIS